MSNVNVTNIPASPELTENSKRIGELWAAGSKTTQAAQTARFDLGEVFLDSRHKLIHNKAFGAWCDNQDWADDISKDNRWGSMNLANNREYAEKLFLQTDCDRTSPRQMWRHIKVISELNSYTLRKLRELESESSQACEDSDLQTENPEIVCEALKTPVFSENPPEKNDVVIAGRRPAANQFNIDMDRDIIINACKLDKSGSIAARYKTLFNAHDAEAREIIRRIAERIKNGMQPKGLIKETNARLAFPNIYGDVPKDYQLSKPSGREKLLQDWEALQWTEDYFIANNIIRDNQGTIAHNQMQRFKLGIKSDAEAVAHLDAITEKMQLSLIAERTKQRPHEAWGVGLIQAYGIILHSPDQPNTWDLTFGQAWGIYMYWQDLDSNMALGKADIQSRGVTYMQMSQWMEMGPGSTVFASVLQSIGGAMRYHSDDKDKTCAPPKFINGK